MAKSGKRTWALIGGGVAACAACCAPLIAPLFMGLAGAGVAGAAAGGVLGLSAGEIACIGIMALLAVGGLFLTLRAVSRRRRAEACACADAGQSGASCDVGGVCNPAYPGQATSG